MVTSIYDYFMEALTLIPEDFINENVTLYWSSDSRFSGICDPGKSMDVIGPRLSIV